MVKLGSLRAAELAFERVYMRPDRTFILIFPYLYIYNFICFNIFLQRAVLPERSGGFVPVQICQQLTHVW